MKVCIDSKKLSDFMRLIDHDIQSLSIHVITFLTNTQPPQEEMAEAWLHNYKVLLEQIQQVRKNFFNLIESLRMEDGQENKKVKEEH